MVAKKQAGDGLREFGRWPSGVDNVHDVRSLQTQRRENGTFAPALRAGVNIDLTPEGEPIRRKGYTEVSPGYAHSLWSPESARFAFLVKDAVLTRVTLDGTTEVLEPIGTVHPTRRMVYAEIAGRVFGSNGISRWAYEDELRQWGIESPGLPAVVATADGGLDAGTYKVNMTYLDRWGEESGCGESATVEVAAGQGIGLLDVPQPSHMDVTRIRVYVSRPNGETLFSSAEFPAGVTAYTLLRADVTRTGKPLETQFCDRVPPCRILTAFKGRLYFAIGKQLFYTMPLRYGLYKRHETYLPMPHNITDVVATRNTLYVGTERATYTLTGNDPKTMDRDDVDGYGMVEGTATRFVRGDIMFAAWWNKDGVLMRAQDGGSVTAVTRNRLALPEYKFGTILHRELDGLSQLVSSLKGPGPANVFTARDRFTAEVTRNGVVIN